jgi:hypothetical protein
MHMAETLTLLPLEITMDFKFYAIRFKNQIKLGSVLISIHF